VGNGYFKGRPVSFFPGAAAVYVVSALDKLKSAAPIAAFEMEQE